MLSPNEVVVFCNVDAVIGLLFKEGFESLTKERYPELPIYESLTTAHRFRRVGEYKRSSLDVDKGMYRDMVNSGYTVITTCKDMEYMKSVLADFSDVRLYDLAPTFKKMLD